MYNHQEDLKIYKTIQILSIDLYSDGNYPRGLSITYLLDGYKSEVKTYLNKLFPEEELTNVTLNLKSNERITAIEQFRTKIITKIKIIVSSEKYIEVGNSNGGDHTIVEIPEGYEAHSLAGCMTNGFPFPAIICMFIKIRDLATGVIKKAESR